MVFKNQTTVYQYLIDVKERKGAGFLVLFDPDRSSLEEMVEKAAICEKAGVDAILVGTSLMMGDGFEKCVEAVSKNVSIPVVIFPGEKSQITEKADAILFLSLLSGRNPDLIIGEQIKSAPVIKAIGLEAVSTAYLLVESEPLHERFQ